MDEEAKLINVRVAPGPRSPSGEASWLWSLAIDRKVVRFGTVEDSESAAWATAYVERTKLVREIKTGKLLS